MTRTDIYLKVTVDHGVDEQPQKLAAEIIRQVQKVYGVRKAELTNFVTQSSADEES